MAWFSTSSHVKFLILFASCFASPHVVVEFASRLRNSAILLPAIESFIRLNMSFSLMESNCSSVSVAKLLSSSFSALSISRLWLIILDCLSFIREYSFGSLFFNTSFDRATILCAVLLSDSLQYTGDPSLLYKFFCRFLILAFISARETSFHHRTSSL